MKKKYKIHISHFYRLEYEEDSKKMYIDIDFRDPVIYLEPILITSWQPPHDNEEVPYKDKKRIIKNIYLYLVDRGYSKDEVKLLD